MKTDFHNENSISLEDILAKVEDDLTHFGEVFSNLLQSPVRIINVIAKHMVKQRGKRIRPALVLFAARLCGESNERSFQAAALIEMLHNATLIHDDVVDSSMVRRGAPTINSIWKNKASVLMGDYILAKSLITATQMNDLRIISILSEASSRMSQGEIDQMSKSRKKDLTEEEYMQIIGDKTAALIEASCRLGPVSLGMDDAVVDKLGVFGNALGLAFQIKDDLLDYEGDEKFFGKVRGTDLNEGKITLPLILALENADPLLRNKILKKVKRNTSSKNVDHIISFMHEHGGIAGAQKKAEAFVETAIASIDEFPDSKYKEALIQLAHFVVNRKK